LRPSNKYQNLSTPAGLLATMVLLIVCTIFFSVRFNTLYNRLGVSYSTYVKADYYYKENNFNWPFYVGRPDPETGYNF
jgi:hypothetical protein